MSHGAERGGQCHAINNVKMVPNLEQHENLCERNMGVNKGLISVGNLEGAIEGTALSRLPTDIKSLKAPWAVTLPVVSGPLGTLACVNALRY